MTVSFQQVRAWLLRRCINYTGHLHHLCATKLEAVCPLLSFKLNVAETVVALQRHSSADRYSSCSSNSVHVENLDLRGLQGKAL